MLPAPLLTATPSHPPCWRPSTLVTAPCAPPSLALPPPIVSTPNSPSASAKAPMTSSRAPVASFPPLCPLPCSDTPDIDTTYTQKATSSCIAPSPYPSGQSSSTASMPGLTCSPLTLQPPSCVPSSVPLTPPSSGPFWPPQSFLHPQGRL